MNVQRLERRDLAQLGAENAERAFSQLVDRPLVRGEVTLVVDPAAPLPSEWEYGVFFELEGDLQARVALLFRASQRDALVAKMLGGSLATVGARAVESALMEVANIVASHVASGIADALGRRLLPSLPTLAPSAAAAERVLLRDGALADCRLCELSDPQGELGALLVIASRPAIA